MSDELWARVSLRIASEHRSTQEIEQLMGKKSAGGQSRLWAIDLTDDSAIRLDEQLQIAKKYLRNKLSTLAGFTDCEINLSIGWTPRSPQDGIVLDVEMIELLASVKCYVLLDTFLD